jgi:hypothetical protein
MNGTVLSSFTASCINKWIYIYQSNRRKQDFGSDIYAVLCKTSACLLAPSFIGRPACPDVLCQGVLCGAPFFNQLDGIFGACEFSE